MPDDGGFALPFVGSAWRCPAMMTHERECRALQVSAENGEREGALRARNRRTQRATLRSTARHLEERNALALGAGAGQHGDRRRRHQTLRRVAAAVMNDGAARVRRIAVRRITTVHVDLVGCFASGSVFMRAEQLRRFGRCRCDRGEAQREQHEKPQHGVKVSAGAKPRQGASGTQRRRFAHVARETPARISG